VRALCLRLGVPLVAARWNTKARMRRRGLGGQAGLRTLRREFLLSAARRVGASWIATAHTADDQLETLLMRLARGTGLDGLGGMSARRGRWLKPLLGLTRAAIEADLTSSGVAWREDPSNHDLSYTRAHVRHVVVPALARAASRSPDASMARATLARHATEAAAELRGARRALRGLVRESAARVVHLPGGGSKVDVRALGACAPAVRDLVLRRLWRSSRPSGGLIQAHLKALRRLVGSRIGARVALPSGRVAVRERDAIRLCAGPGPDAPRPTLVIPRVGRWAVGGLSGRWLAGSRVHDVRQGSTGLVFAAEGLEGRLQLRSATPDESFIPYGRRRPRPLGQFLSKERANRRSMVLADGRGILWVVGVRRSARALIGPDTRRALWIDTEPHE
jgi:tRNA(Ile)-lysidine synthase